MNNSETIRGRLIGSNVEKISNKIECVSQMELRSFRNGTKTDINPEVKKLLMEYFNIKTEIKD